MPHFGVTGNLCGLLVDRIFITQLHLFFLRECRAKSSSESTWGAVLWIVQGAEWPGCSGHFNNSSWNKLGATWQQFQACSGALCYEVAMSVHHLWIELLEQNFDLSGCGAAASPSCGCLGCLAAILGTQRRECSSARLMHAWSLMALMSGVLWQLLCDFISLLSVSHPAKSN